MTKKNNKQFKPDTRIVSADTMPAGKNTCNGMLQSRDGYCQSPGVAEFNRCRRHGGKNALKSLDVFNKAVGLKNANVLQAMIEDTLSMDNELGAAKIMLVNNIEQHEKANILIEEFLSTKPIRPDENASPVEERTYSDAVTLHESVLAQAMHLRDTSFANAAKMVKIISDGIEKNHKIKMGSKFTMDVKQISSIIKVQLQVMSENCKGCPKLRGVIRGMKERMQDIPIQPDVSKRNRKVMGERAYADMMDKVEQAGEHFAEADIEDIDIDEE